MDTLISYVLPIFGWPWIASFLFGYSLLPATRSFRGSKTRAQYVARYLVGASLFYIALHTHFYGWVVTREFFDPTTMLTWIADHGLSWLLLAAIGFVLYLTYARYLSPAIADARLRSARKMPAKTQDIVPPQDPGDAKQYWLPPRRQPVDPRSHFRAGRRLVGLTRADHPIYWPADVDHPEHIHVVAQTGAGKGRWLGVWLWQCLADGDAVVVNDPKGDDWLPHVLHEAARQFGVPYTFLDLRQRDGAAGNLLAHLEPHQVEEVLEASLSLYRTGTNADVYRGMERAAMEDAVAAWRPGQSLSSWYRDAIAHQAEDAKEWAAKARELSRVATICGDTDYEPIWDAIHNGGVVYVLGNMSSGHVGFAMRAITRYVMLVCESRADRGRAVQLVLDECYRSLSLPALDALTAARAWNLHLTMAHTDMSDLLALAREGMEYRHITGLLSTNCPLSIVGRLSADGAEWASKRFGIKSDYREMLETELTAGWAESVKTEGGRRLMQTERPLISEGIIENLPKYQVLAHGVPARPIPPLLHSDFIPVAPRAEAVRSSNEFTYTPPVQRGAPIDFLNEEPTATPPGGEDSDTEGSPI